jgi:hypothetical protein
MANFTGKIIGVSKTAVEKLNGLQPTATASLKSVNTKPYLPGFTWESALSVPTGEWVSVAYGNGTFVAVSSTPNSTQAIMTSPDGLTWTLQTTPAGKTFSRITYGGGLFVVVGSQNVVSTSQIMTSPDGITWTVQTHPSCNLASIAYGNGIYVVINQGSGGSASTNDDTLVSSDGITWVLNASAVPSETNFRQIHFYDGYFITSGILESNILYSTDGITWSTTPTSTSGTWRGVAWASSGPVAGLYVLGSTTFGLKEKSTSITTPFTPVNNIGPNFLSTLTYCDISGVFVGVEQLAFPGVGVERIATSSSADDWTGRSGITTRGRWVTYGDNKLVIVGLDFASISY